MSWCIVAFLITFVTLSSAANYNAQDAKDICNRIKSYKLKILTMGLVGDQFIVLTTEGHLFYLPRDNLQNVDISNPTLRIDRVPLSANRVFGAALDYNIRQDSSHLLFFLLLDSKSKIEFLMSLKVEQWQVRIQAHHLDWKKRHKRHKLNWTRNKEDDLAPYFILNSDNAQCAQTIQMSKIFNDNQVFSQQGISQQICMNGDSLSAKPIDSHFYSCFGSFSPASYTAFEWKGRQPGSPSFVSHLNENRLYFKIKKIEGSFDCAGSSWSSLSDFIQCGSHFTDNTSRWQPPEAVDQAPVAVTNSNATTQAATTREKRTRWISGWTIVTVILIGLSACLVIMILRLYMKREPKKLSRKDKQQHSSIGSSAISSSAIGSSSTVDSSNVASSGDLSACSDESSCPISAASSSSSAVTSSRNSSGTSSAASQSKSWNRSLMDGIFSLLKKHKKKNANQRANDKKAKENKKKGSKK